MNRTLLALTMVLCSVASAQVEVVYPYNPDGNADGAISSPDLLDFLPVFASEFTPEEILVNGVTLSHWVDSMETEVDEHSNILVQMWGFIFQLQGELQNLQYESNAMDAEITALQEALDSALTESSTVDLEPMSRDSVVGIAFRKELAYSNLQGRYMQNENWAGADFRFANLSQTNWYQSYLGGADCEGADLTNASFSSSPSSMMNNVNFTNANLHRLNGIGDKVWSGCTLTGATMTCLAQCPAQLPSGYECIEETGDVDCQDDNTRYRVVLLD